MTKKCTQRVWNDNNFISYFKAPLPEATNTSVAPRQRPRGQNTSKISPRGGVLPLLPPAATPVLHSGRSSVNNSPIKTASSSTSYAGTQAVAAAVPQPTHAQAQTATNPFSKGLAPHPMSKNPFQAGSSEK